MFYERYNGTAQPPFPSDWHLDIVHDHSEPEARWVALVYYRQKGQKIPLPAKYISSKIKENRQALVARRKMANDSRPGR